MRKTYFPWICGGWIFSTSQLLIDGNWSLPRESATQNPYQPLLPGSQFFQLISTGGKLFREIYAKYDTPTLHRGDTMSRTFWAMDHKELSSSNGLLQTWNFKMSSICEILHFHFWKCRTWDTASLPWDAKAEKLSKFPARSKNDRKVSILDKSFDSSVHHYPSTEIRCCCYRRRTNEELKTKWKIHILFETNMFLVSIKTLLILRNEVLNWK